MSLQPLLRRLPLSRTLAPSRLPPRTLCRGITSKPPRDPIGPMESFVAFSTFFLAFMVPSGWILSHLESYKSRE